MRADSSSFPLGAPLPHEGALPAADTTGVDATAVASGESGSMDCGPGVRFSLRLDEDGRVVAAAFETVAFDAARPAASRLCAAVIGRTVEDASRVSLVDVAALAGLPPRHPVVRTVLFAKSAALLPVLGRRARTGPDVTCICFQVPTETILRAIRRHRLTTAEDVKARTKAGSGCGTCRPDVERLLRDAASPAPSAPEVRPTRRRAGPPSGP